MQRLDPPHESPSPRTATALPTLAEVAALQRLLAEEDWSLVEATALVDAAPGLKRAVLRAVLSADVATSQPVAGTWHALAILGERRLRRLVERLQRELASETLAAAS
jgi:hypothetical protein